MAFNYEISQDSHIYFITAKMSTVRGSCNEKFGVKIFSRLYLLQDLYNLYSVKILFVVFLSYVYFNDKSLGRVFRILQ